MKSRTRLIALLTPFMCLTGCSSASNATSVMSSELKGAILKSPVLSEETDEPAGYSLFAAKVNNFSAKFTEAMLASDENDDNTAISPVSVFLALAMTAESSSGRTRQEILDAIGMTYEELQENISYFCRSLNKTFTYEDLTGVKNYGQIKLTNSIWFDEGMTIKEKLLTVLAGLYDSYSFQVDFSDKDTNDLIREFIRLQTNGLIDQDLQADASTLVILLNTLYFKDVWDKYDGDLSYAKNQYTFTSEDGSAKLIDLLNGHYFNGKVYEAEDYKSFYTETSAGYRLTFVVPNYGKSVEDVFDYGVIKDAVTHEYVKNNVDLGEEYFTNCYFPEFSASYSGSIKSVLYDDFGISKAFIPGLAEFDETSDSPLYVSDVDHIVKLNVTKSGIEGAAVTAVTEAGASMPELTRVENTFIVNRSFGYTLSKGTGILFSGIVRKL